MGWSRRVRAALAAALAVCVLATLWRMSECWSGSCAYLRYFSGDHPADGRKHSDGHPAVPGAGGEVVSGGGNEGPAGAHKVVPNRAVAVVFSDVHDVLVLERALALWRSIGMFFSPGIEDDVVAIVPRYRALQLEAPLREIGYRVLPRDSPAPAWRTSGRFVQQALTGAGKSKGWSLLALEALSLTEYEEVVVLDQKMFLFPSSGSPATGEQKDAAGAEGVGGDLGAEGGGDGGDGGSPWDLLLRLLPPRVSGGDGGWNVAFAEGGEASVARGEGLTALPGAVEDFVSRRHASLMVVRPSLRLYESVANILCKGDAVMDGAYTDVSRPHGESIRSATLERRAPTAPLLHLAIAISLSSNSSSSPPPPDGDAPLLPLKPCGGYGNGQSNSSNNNRGALPIAWCPPEQDGENLAEEKGEGVESDQRHGPGRVLAGLSLPPSKQQRRKKESLKRRGRYGTTPGASAATGSGEPTKNRSRGGSRNAPKTPPLEINGFQPRQGFAPSLRRWAGKSDARRETGTGRKGRGVTASTSPTRSSGGSADGGRATRAAVRRLSAESSAGVVRGGTRGEPNAEASTHGRNGEEDEKKKVGSPKAVDRTKSPDGVENQAKTRVDNGGWRTWLWWQRRRELEQEVASGRSVSFAWIPGDPCSCAGVENGDEGDEGGVVGVACRAWLEARAAPLMAGDEDPPDARSACSGGALASPRSIPRPLETSVLQNLEFAAATAGAIVAASGVGDGKEAAIGGGAPASVAGEEEDAKGDAREEGAVVMPPVPPPLWQERPTTKVVVTQEDLKNFQHFWAVNEEKKLLMVAIPKVACTQVHALFLRMQGSKRWNTSVLSEIHFHKDQSKYTMSTVKGMTAQKATDILNDPSWTRGVFLRDPAERLLSCFLDKIVHRKSYSVNILRAREILSFESFVGLLSKDARERYGDTFPGPQLGISRRSNPHWRPQVYFGLDKFLPYFDFIGDFNHMQEHSEELLRRAGLWEEFGASGWGPGGKNAFFQRPTVQGHATGSESAKSLYYSYPLLTSVREAYGPTDYRMLARLGWWWNETAFPLGY